MGNKKRKRGCEGEGRTIHPRNRYADNPPDFSLLASLYPSFSSFVHYSPDGRPSIDWTDFNATRELTRTLLLHDHSLNWWIPDGQLCPTVPNRSNYIHWIEDLLASDIIEKNIVDGDKVRGFDIGTGANCIYPLLGASLLGWSFVGSDVTDVALKWAVKNVKSNPHISELIDIRRVEIAEHGNSCGAIHLDGKTSDNYQKGGDHDDLNKRETRKFGESTLMNTKDRLDDANSLINEEMEGINERINGEAHTHSSTYPNKSYIDKGYLGSSVLLGVVKEGESFVFCMCNPPFFESMDEAGLNPKTSCGGTPEEMVYPGGERAFISRIIEDSVILKQSFRWYTSMVGKKSNLKFLMSKLRELGVTIVKTTEFVQGKTSRWGLAWSFMPPVKKLVSLPVRSNASPSIMLEGLQRQTSAFDVLQSVEYFFNYFGASCKSNDSTFKVDVSSSENQCDTILKTDVKMLDETSTSLRMNEASGSASCSNSPMNLSFCVMVFQQIPGTLLLKASLQLKNSPLSGPILSDAQQGLLDLSFSKDDIKAALWSIPDDKSPGLDGFNSKFYKASWDVVGDDVVNAINFFRTDKMDSSWHVTTITLIPKVKCLAHPGDFRPISCFHVLYKCISKLICSKLKLLSGNIIDPAQGAFVADRSIMHNILLCQDLMKQYSRSHSVPSCLIKIDLCKAYDTMD